MSDEPMTSLQVQGLLGLFAMLIPAVIAMVYEACEWLESRRNNRKGDR